MNEQLIIRAANLNDLSELLELSHLVGSGMTSMPSDRQSWVDKLERSIADFQREDARKNGDIYFMVMEDIASKKIVGSGAVYAGIGLERPFYSYKLATITSSSEKLDLTVHTRVLNLVNDFTGATEIGSLFLRPEYRRDGIGKFLSRSRFLLLADFPERFDETVFAEMRGWLDEHSHSPFWDSLGRKFFGLSFQKADFISAVDGFQFISDLMPKYPVYVDLLSEQAQEVIGKPHNDAAGAFRILQTEGFKYSGYVDIFDAGPSISTTLEQINSVANSANASVAAIGKESDLAEQASYLISNGKLSDYRMTRAAGAFRILQTEGFKYSGYVDIFDAGPSISTTLEQINSVANSANASVAAIGKESDLAEQASYLISNGKLSDYRMTRAAVAIDDNGDINISDATANNLNIEPGETVRILRERAPKTEQKS